MPAVEEPPEQPGGVPEIFEEPHWLVLGSLLVLIVGGSLARNWLGIEWDANSVRDLVLSTGYWGPILFILVLAFRFLLFIPSIILLTAGGLCFGAVGGTVFGALGLTLSGLIKYGIVRWAGAEAFRAQIPRAYRGLLDLARSSTGASFVALISSYPAGPIGAVHIAAAVSGMYLFTFLIAVGAGSLARSAVFSIFGSQLVEGGGLWLGGGLIALTVVVPLLFPQTRAWLRQSFARNEEP